MTWMILRQAAAFGCLALGAWHYLGWIPAAFVLFCVYWALWKKDPDSPFAIVAWPVWYLAGFVAAAALLYDLIYLQPWAMCSAVVLFELYFLPIQRRDYAAWAEAYNKGAAEQAYAAAKRIRWRGQDARALSALMLARERLKAGRAAEAERLADEALPEFQRAPQIQGVTVDAVYLVRGAARARAGNAAGSLEDLQAATHVRKEWAPEAGLDRGWLLLARGQLLLEAGLYGSARQAAERAVAVLAGEPDGEERAAALLAEVHTRAGEDRAMTPERAELDAQMMLPEE